MEILIDDLTYDLSHMEHVKRYGTTYHFLKKTKKKQSGSMGPMQHALEEMDVTQNKLAIMYEQRTHGRWFASYPSINGFLKRYKKISEKGRRFYEILNGAVHTYAELNWEYDADEPNDLKVSHAFEELFWAVVHEQLGITHDTGEIIWSTSSAEGKGYLQFKYEHDDLCWQSPTVQKRFWEAAIVYCNAHKEQFRVLYDSNEARIINSSVYAKHHMRRCIESHAYGSEQLLVYFVDLKRWRLRDYFVPVEEPTGDFFEMAL